MRNEDGETVQREIKLATNYAAGDWMKVALMVGTAAEDRLMQLYVTGNRTGADIYDTSFNFRQDNPQEITIDSAEADVEIKCIRVYNRAISDDEELENRMVDSETTDEMMEIYSENDIIGDTGDVDMDKLRAMGKGCCASCVRTCSTTCTRPTTKDRLSRRRVLLLAARQRL